MFTIIAIIFLIVPIQASTDVVDVDTFLRQCDVRVNPHRYKRSEKKLIHSYCLSQDVYAEKGNLVTVYFRYSNGKTKPRQVQVYDPDHRLMDDHQEFKPGDIADSGTRTVGFYSIYGHRRLCFKQYPEMPGNELAMYELYKTLFPRDCSDLPLPASEVILMNGQVFLVSQFMCGETLEKVLKKIEEGDNNNYYNYTFDLEKFQKLSLFCFLTNPEDLRPQNCLVRKANGSDKYQFILIDNERSFCQEVIEGDGEIETRVHCALFCFRELMEGKLYNLLPRSNTIDNSIKEWIKQCEANDRYLHCLKAYCTNESKKALDVPVGKLVAGDISKKLFKILNILNKGEKSLIDIFEEILPKLASIYLPNLPDNESEIVPKETSVLKLALKRIDTTDGGRFSSPTTPRSANVPSERWKINKERLVRAKNGSYRGEISKKTKRPKSIFVKGYFRKDGVYIRDHYRSHKSY